LFDAYLVPKPLSQQLLQFGRSGDGLEMLTFGVELFWFSPQGADGPRGAGGRSASALFVACSSCSCLPSFSIRCDFEFWLGEVSDGPRVSGGQSVCSPRTVRFQGSLLEVLLALTDSPWPRSDGPPYLCGQSAVHWRTVYVLLRTVRPSWPDGPPEPSCFALWFDSFLPSFVLPRVL
jgi:hypothetical protein